MLQHLPPARIDEAEITTPDPINPRDTAVRVDRNHHVPLASQPIREVRVPEMVVDDTIACRAGPGGRVGDVVVDVKVHIEWYSKRLLVSVGCGPSTGRMIAVQQDDQGVRR